MKYLPLLCAFLLAAGCGPAGDASGGMFGVYVGTWSQPMPSNDPHIVALAKAIDACTKGHASRIARKASRIARKAS